MEILVFALGSFFYGATEILYRGYTHWSMVLTGGAIVLTLYILGSFLLDLNIFIAAFTGTFIITAYEFFVGLIVNRWFHWNVWDYSNQPLNILGQICPLFSFYWFVICLAFFALIKYNKGILF